MCLPRKILRIIQYIRTQIPVQATNSSHILIRESKLHNFKVLSKVIWLGTRYCYKTTLNNPAKYYLRCSFIIFNRRYAGFLPNTVSLMPSYRLLRSAQLRLAVDHSLPSRTVRCRRLS